MITNPIFNPATKQTAEELSVSTLLYKIKLATFRNLLLF